MAKKIKSSGSPATGATPTRGPATAARRLGLAMLTACALLGASGAFFWHRHLGATLPLHALPAMPDLAGRPEELKRRLAAAQARAGAKETAEEGVVELGRLYHATGFHREAETCWRLLRAAQPREARWCYYLADLRRIAADVDELKSLLEETTRLAPDYGPAWLELAELEFKTGRLDGAERAYRRRLELVPGDPYAGLGLARLALQRGRREDGKRQLEELIRQAPDFPSSHNLYAELLAQDGDSQGAANQRWLGTVAGRFRAAEDPWTDELRAWCYDPDQLLVWGTIDLQTRHGDRGRALFERAIQLAPENPRGYDCLGNLCLDQGDSAKAREVLEAGSRLPQASEQLFASLCDAYRAARRPDQALRVAEQGLQLMPGSSLLANARGLALDDADRPEEAIQAYRSAMALGPGAADPVANLGVDLLRLGRRDEALAKLHLALALQPMLPKALTLLARVALDAGDLPAAAGYIFPYFQQYPGLNNARDLMAKYFLRLAMGALQGGDAAAAERACHDGLSIVPGAAELYGFLGVVCARQGRLSEALPAMETAHRLQPADPRGTMSLGELYVRLGRIDDARRLLTKGEELARQRGEAAVAARYVEQLEKLPR